MPDLLIRLLRSCCCSAGDWVLTPYEDRVYDPERTEAVAQVVSFVEVRTCDWVGLSPLIAAHSLDCS